MSSIEINHTAKCKYCKFFKTGRITKVNGELGKRKTSFCDNPKSKHWHQVISQKFRGCDKFELNI